MRTSVPKFLIPWLAITMFAFAAGCSESERATCSAPADCADGQICREGTCIVPSRATCDEDHQCGTGYICVANQCARNASSNTDAGLTDSGSNQGQRDASSPKTDTDEQDAEIDTSNPRVIDVFPKHNAKDVPLDAAIKVMFDKPMDEIYSLNIKSLKLQDPDGRPVEDATISYDPDTKTATFKTTEPLRAASRYEITATPDLKDESGISLAETYTYFFYTAHNPPANHLAIAELYAPVIYQGIRDLTGSSPHGDTPTRVDFDDDMDADNNRINAGAPLTNVPANVYYHVTETQSHYFVHYVLYYPSRVRSNKTHEHDLTGINITVDKETQKIHLIEGFLAEPEASDAIFSYKPASSPYNKPESTTSKLISVPDEGFEDGTRFPLFISAGQHFPCAWYARGGETGGLTRCPERTQQFQKNNEHGVVMRPGATAQTIAEAVEREQDTGLKKMTYKLIPFVETFWLNRSDSGCGLYKSHTVYKPADAVPNLSPRPVGAEPEKPLTLPQSLCTQEDVSYGKLPFTWGSDAKSSGGQWFMDPIYRVMEHFTIAPATPPPLSAQYCQNIFFNIDDRSNANCDD